MIKLIFRQFEISISHITRECAMQPDFLYTDKYKQQ